MQTAGADEKETRHYRITVTIDIKIMEMKNV